MIVVIVCFKINNEIVCLFFYALTLSCQYLYLIGLLNIGVMGPHRKATNNFKRYYTVDWVNSSCKSHEMCNDIHALSHLWRYCYQSRYFIVHRTYNIIHNDLYSVQYRTWFTMCCQMYTLGGRVVCGI